MKKYKKIFFISFIALAILLVPQIAYAHCPLCTLGVGAAAASAKYFGLDVSIIGLFVGAFGISTGLWFARAIKKKFIPYQTAIITLLSYLLTVIPLRFISTDNLYLPILLFGEPGSFLNKIYWIDMLIFGSIIGGLVTTLGYYIHNMLKKKNNDKVLFPYQGIALTLGILIIAGAILFFTVK